MEIFSFTGITSNGDGSGTLTGVIRGLAFYGATASTATGNNKAHQSGSQFVLSNVQYYYDQLMDLDSNETVTGVKTFAHGATPVITDAPLASTDASNKAYVDLVAGGIAITNQVLVSGTAGGNLTAGMPVYKKASDGKWYNALANDTTTFQQLELGIAQAVIATSGTGTILLRGLDSNQSGLAAGTQYFLTDAGGISATPGTNTVFLGYGQTTTTFIFDPRSPYDIPYHGEKLALVGDNTDIAVGSGNKFVTQTGLEHNAEKYFAVVSNSSTAYVATLSPAPTSQTDGMVIYLKMDLANTTSTPTIALNGLTARTIVKQGGTALLANDIAAGSINTFIYDLTNTRWVLQSPTKSIPITNNAPYTLMSSAVGTFNAASSGNVTVAHGLGFTPRYVKITALLGDANGKESSSYGIYNGSTTNTVGGGSSVGNSTTNAVMVYYNGSGNAWVATATMDATNVTLAGTTSGTATGTGQILVEAYT